MPHFSRSLLGGRLGASTVSASVGGGSTSGGRDRGRLGDGDGSLVGPLDVAASISVPEHPVRGGSAATDAGRASAVTVSSPLRRGATASTASTAGGSTAGAAPAHASSPLVRAVTAGASVVPTAASVGDASAHYGRGNDPPVVPQWSAFGVLLDVMARHAESSLMQRLCLRAIAAFLLPITVGDVAEACDGVGVSCSAVVSRALQMAVTTTVRRHAVSLARAISRIVFLHAGDADTVRWRQCASLHPCPVRPSPRSCCGVHVDVVVSAPLSLLCLLRALRCRSLRRASSSCCSSLTAWWTTWQAASATASSTRCVCPCATRLARGPRPCCRRYCEPSRRCATRRRDATLATRTAPSTSRRRACGSTRCCPCCARRAASSPRRSSWSRRAATTLSVAAARVCCGRRSSTCRATRAAARHRHCRQPRGDASPTCGRTTSCDRRYGPCVHLSTVVCAHTRRICGVCLEVVAPAAA